MTVIEGTSLAARTREDVATWSEVERGFWVGNRRGEFLGTVEGHAASRFFARDSARRYVGEYPRLELATAALVERAG